ncbi:MAG: PorT family protein [Muribaculaceae bacterium]|nr:PorT family protein [Muribaculaceae bacterium]
MRKTIILLLTLISGLPALAEGLWGAKASLDFNVPGKWHVDDFSTELYRSGLGFSLGGVYSRYFNDNVFLEPSLSFFYDTYSCDFIINEHSDITPGVYKVGLRLPLVVGYTFDITDEFSLSVFTGPELDYAFAGGYRIKDKSFDDDLGPLLGSDGVQHSLSCAWKGGIGFPFSAWRVDFEAALGLTDIIRHSPSCKENRFSISLLRYF